jgi:hypothetical protein
MVGMHNIEYDIYATSSLRSSSLQPQAHAVKANGILTSLSELLAAIKHAADKCTSLAQMNIQWLKALDRAKAMGFPRGLQEIVRLIELAAPSERKKKARQQAGGKAARVVVTMGECSAIHAQEPLEEVCMSTFIDR